MIIIVLISINAMKRDNGDYYCSLNNTNYYTKNSCTMNSQLLINKVNMKKCFALAVSTHLKIATIHVSRQPVVGDDK